MLPYFPPPDGKFGPSKSSSENPSQGDNNALATDDSSSNPTPSDSLQRSLKLLEEQNSELKSTVDSKQATIDELTAELQKRKAKERKIKVAYFTLLEEHTKAIGPGTQGSGGSTISTGESESDPVESADMVSRAEVEERFKALNSQILAICSACSDTVAIRTSFQGTKLPREPLKESGITVEMVNNLQQIIGQKLVDTLRKLDYSENRLAIFLSMQAVLSFFVSRVCESYPFAPTRKANQGGGIWSIYDSIHKNGA